MNHRRVNRSKKVRSCALSTCVVVEIVAKVPGVKLRPADPSARKDLRTPDSTWTHSSGLDSDEETTHADLCPRPFKGLVLCATGISDKVSRSFMFCDLCHTGEIFLCGNASGNMERR